MSETWLPGVRVVNLTNRSNGAGNGPFGSPNAGQFLGVVLHCNGATGIDTSDEFFAGGGGPDSVCPNFQVHQDGTIAQYLPLEWSPWCQEDGNAHYGAIETAGGAEPLNQAQVASVAKIVRAYHDVLGMPLQIANAPGQQGFGYHAMGGADWGGHPCPLPARIAQRASILILAGSGDSGLSNGATPIGDDTLSAAEVKQIEDYLDAGFLDLKTHINGLLAPITSHELSDDAHSVAALGALTKPTGVLDRLTDIQKSLAKITTSGTASAPASINGTYTITKKG